MLAINEAQPFLKQIKCSLWVKNKGKKKMKRREKGGGVRGGKRKTR